MAVSRNEAWYLYSWTHMLSINLVLEHVRSGARTCVRTEARLHACMPSTVAGYHALSDVAYGCRCLWWLVLSQGTTRWVTLLMAVAGAAGRSRRPTSLVCAVFTPTWSKSATRRSRPSGRTAVATSARPAPCGASRLSWEWGGRASGCPPRAARCRRVTGEPTASRCMNSLTDLHCCFKFTVGSTTMRKNLNHNSIF